MAHDSGRAADIQRERYRVAARAGDWQTCADVARLMQRLVHGLVETAETTYALGYALEMLGDTTRAKTNYQLALFMDRRHEKARRRLRSLDASGT
jgi:hypothetical protein